MPLPTGQLNQKERAKLPAIVFDFDDTLVHTLDLYWMQLDRAAKYVEAMGLNPAAYVELQKRIDVENQKTWGYDHRRYAQSGVEALEALCLSSDIASSDEARRTVRGILNSVFTESGRFEDGVFDVLAAVYETNRVYIFTKGESWVQNTRLFNAGVLHYTDGHIVHRDKGEAQWKSLVDFWELDPTTTTFVGNSMKADVWPGVKLGGYGVHLRVPTWAPDADLPGDFDPDHPKLHVVDKLRDLPEIVETNAVVRRMFDRFGANQIALDAADGDIGPGLSLV